MAKKRITMRDLAEMANVSVATISMALNGKPGVSDETREYILSLAEKQNYVMNINARSLKTNINSLIGVIVPDIQNPFFSTLVSELNNFIDAENYTMLLGISGELIETDLIKEMCSRGVAGIILVPSFRQNDSSFDYNFFDIPIVLCTVISEAKGIASVACDLRQGEYLMTKHLLERGYETFSFVGLNPKSWITRERYEGFLQALSERFSNKYKYKFVEAKKPSFKSGYEIAATILKSPPSAVICINDVLALGIMEYFQENGISVPKDIAIVGFDDVWITSLIKPQLTTIRQPLEKIAKTTVRLILGQIMKDEYKTYRSVLVEPILKIRQTTL